MKFITLIIALFLIQSKFLLAAQHEISSDFNLQTGDNVTVWQEYKNNQCNIVASINVGNSIIGPTEIGHPSVIPKKPRAAINSSHRVAVVWLGVDQETNQTSLYGAMYDPASGWTKPTLISEPHLESVYDHVNIHLAETGKVAVSWKSFMLPAHQTTVRLSQSASFGKWGTPVHLSN